MAGCIENVIDVPPDWIKFKDNLSEQNQEIDALKSYYDNTDNLEIIQEASQSDKKKYFIQVILNLNLLNNYYKLFNLCIFKLKIPIETALKPIKVEVWLPIDQINFESKDDKAPKDPKKPCLERTISGKRAHTSIDCESLTPIQLDITLPDSYPSESKPLFTIASEWLSRSQLSQLSLKLNQLWEENVGMPILFTWCEWVKTGLVEYLELFEPPNLIHLTPLNVDEVDLGNDLAIQSLFESGEDLILKLLR